MIRTPTWAAPHLAAAALITLFADPSALAEEGLDGRISPHLEMHADGPVSWMPWSEAAFEKAAKEKKMVYLSIGYSACNWCRRMNDEVFSDPSMGAVLNRSFVNIKVDRIERPDVDAAFRAYALASGSDYGWPLNIWLTPAGAPVSAAGFMKRDNSQPGSARPMRKWIDHLQKQWTRHSEYVHEQSLRDIAKLREALVRKPAKEMEPIDPAAAVDSFYTKLGASFNPSAGGFDAVVMFPRPEHLEAIAFLARREKVDAYRRTRLLKMLTRTLDGMLAGAVVDPLSGGVFRYALDSGWRLPQFEHMLVDQSRFGVVLLSAYQLTGDPRYANAARHLIDFTLESLGAPDGTFYTSIASHRGAGGDQKAAGEYYLWTMEEVSALLDEDEMSAFTAAFGMLRKGNLPPSVGDHGLPQGVNVLYAAQPAARNPADGTPLASAIAKVRAARAARVSPVRNEMVVSGWNGLAISTLSRAASVLGESRYLDAARRCADAILADMFDAGSGRLARGRSPAGPLDRQFAQDYVYLTRGLIDLYNAGGETRYLEIAINLQSIASRDFFDSEIGLHHMTPLARRDELPFPLWSVIDGDLPSIDGIAALNMLDLSAIDGDAERRARAALIVRAGSGDFSQRPESMPTALRAIVRSSSSALQVVFTGDPGSAEGAALLRAARQSAPAEVPVLVIDGAERGAALGRLREGYRAFEAGAKPQVYLCRELKAGNPTSSPQAAAAGIAAMLRRR